LTLSNIYNLYLHKQQSLSLYKLFYILPINLPYFAITYLAPLCFLAYSGALELELVELLSVI
jgi:hypothetical protein